MDSEKETSPFDRILAFISFAGIFVIAANAIALLYSKSYYSSFSAEWIVDQLSITERLTFSYGILLLLCFAFSIAVPACWVASYMGHRKLLLRAIKPCMITLIFTGPGSIYFSQIPFWQGTVGLSLISIVLAATGISAFITIASDALFKGDIEEGFGTLLFIPAALFLLVIFGLPIPIGCASAELVRRTDGAALPTLLINSAPHERWKLIHANESYIYAGIFSNGCGVTRIRVLDPEDITVLPKIRAKTLFVE